MMAPRHDGTVIEVGPPVTPWHSSLPEGAKKREGSTGVPFRASLELGQWCSDQVMAMM
jgi:hypothetical protein